ncbi:MAG: aminotransferase class V-fold PLP-dependent enzyme [Bacteroidota bacterium]
MASSLFLPDELLAKVRGLFPHTSQGNIYLNTAGTSPLSTRVLAAMTGYLTERSIGILDTFQRDRPMVAECKQFIQQIINAESPDRIAVTPNTSDAINILASGLPWKTGDHILLNTAEFPANVWPYMNLKRLGVQLDFIPCPDGKVPIDRILDGITPRTRIVALSAVQFLSGYRADLETIGEVCKSRGMIFAVDAIQAVGAVRINVQKMRIDALAAGGQKWQMAPHGSGFLYLTEELQSIIQQKSIGWLSVADPWDYTNFQQPLAPSARRYEGGSMAMPSLWGMHASLSTILEFGVAAIESHILSLTGTLVDELRTIPQVNVLTPADPSERAGIVTIELTGKTDAREVFKKLIERNITVALRDGKLRYSPHFYCSVDDMHAVVAATRESLQ